MEGQGVEEEALGLVGALVEVGMVEVLLRQGIHPGVVGFRTWGGLFLRAISSGKRRWYRVSGYLFGMIYLYHSVRDCK